MDIGILRAIEDAVDAISRLDERVATGPVGLSALLRLRSAQAIVAANDRPIEGEGGDGAPPANQPVPDGDAAFAALLGWVFAPDAREFIADDPHLRRVAIALATLSERLHSGCLLTAGVLDDAFAAAGLTTEPLPDLLDASLSVAVHEGWPPLLMAADLSAGACGRVRSLSASVARAVAPLGGGLVSDVFVVGPMAEDMPEALHGIATEARVMRRRVDAYRDSTDQVLERCRSMGRGGPSAAALAQLLAGQPATTVADAASRLDLTAPTAGAAVERLMQIDALHEITGRGRDRVFVYTPAVALAG